MRYHEIEETMNMNEIVLSAPVIDQETPILDDTNSKQMGTYDGYDIWATTWYKNHTAFCILDTNKNVIAQLIISDDVTIVHSKSLSEIKRVWVEPNHRGKGLATALYAFVVKKMKCPLMSDMILTSDGMKQVRKMIDSGFFDVSFYDGKHNVVVDVEPDGLMNQTNNWRVILENGYQGAFDHIFGHGISRQLDEHRFFCDPKDGWE